YYATQVGTAPPTVVLFVNKPSLFDAPYQRYLLNVFRQKLPFRDIPIKLYLRARSQADPSAPKAPDPTIDAGSRVHRGDDNSWQDVEELLDTPSPSDEEVDDEDLPKVERDADKLLNERGE